MISLLPSCGGTRFDDNVKKVVKKKKQNKKGVASAFTPGLLRLNTRDDSAREILLNIYRETLKKCGFVVGSRGLRNPSTWKIILSPSSSYEVQMSLDDKMNVQSIKERNLHWIHATLISGDKQEFVCNIHQNPDIRLLISTSDVVKEDSDLYRTVLPEINGEHALPIQIGIDGRPVLARVTSKRVKDIVQTVRHVQRLEMFTNGSTDASIVYGDCYFGEKLVLKRPFCELSLYINPEKLQDAISNFVDKEKLEEFTKEFFNTSLLVGDTLACHTAVFANVM